MLKRGRIVLVLLVVALAGLAGAWLYFGERAEFYSDPAMVRTNASYATARAERKEVSKMPEGFFDRFHLQQGSNVMDLRMPTSRPGTNGGEQVRPMRIQEADGTNAVRVGEGEGRLRLAFVGVLHSVPLPTNAGVLKTRPGFSWWAATSITLAMPLHLFGADLSPVTEADVQRLVPGHYARVGMRDHYPLARFYFAHDMPVLQPTSIEVFDGRTQWPLSSTYRDGIMEGVEGVFWLDVPIRAWHQTPLEVVVTMMAGPLEEVTAKFEPGAELKFAGGRIRVAAVKEGTLGTITSGREGEARAIRLPLHEPPESEGPRCTAVLYGWPSATALLREIEFLDGNGNEIKLNSRFAEVNFMTFELRAETKDVRSVRLRHYPRMDRVIFRLAELPGLPKENRGVTNLFDVHVPYAHFSSEHQFQTVLKELVQMHAGYIRLNSPTGFFPADRTNTTVRELFLEMEGMLSNPGAMVVPDAENNLIEVRRNSVREMVRRWKVKVGR